MPEGNSIDGGNVYNESTRDDREPATENKMKSGRKAFYEDD